MDLTRDAILAAPDRELVPVDVPEWGGTVYLAPLTAAQRDSWEADTFTEGKVRRDNMRARLLSRVLVDKAGEPLFGRADVEALGGKSAKVLDNLFDRALEMNGMGPNAVEDAEKNLNGGPAAGSPSD